MKNDTIERKITLRAPLKKVWEALTDHRQFGEWFKARIDAPFTVGAESTGQITYPGYENYRWQALVVAIEPEKRFAFRWPHADGPELMDLRTAPTTLVEFILEPVPQGTLLTMRESGFSALPEGERDKRFRMNSEGWDIQSKNIAEYVAQ
jgi:uncharacterized protein YndB with AHSA1/START domain